MSRSNPKIEAFTVPLGVVDLAYRRTEFLIGRIVNWDMPLKTALANSYVQGMNDAMEVLFVGRKEPTNERANDAFGTT